MNRPIDYGWLLAIIIGFTIISCENDYTNTSLENKTNEKNVSLDLAKQVALNFTKDKAFIKKPDKVSTNADVLRSNQKLDKEIKEAYVVSQGDEPAFYIILFEPNGFAFISATVKEEPVIAFSESAEFDFDNLPIGLNQWIDFQKQRIISIKNSDIEVPQELLDEWDRYLGHPDFDPETGDDPVDNPNEGNYHIVKGPLMQTTWGQGCGYNNLINSNCNSGGACNRPWTGCVATAMAQIIRYYEYPNNYDYSIMLDKVEFADRNTTGANEISKLMRDVGNAVDMDYGCGGSGADTEDEVASSFKNDFGYSSATYHNNYNGSTKYEWVKSEINADRPVIFRGGEQKHWGGVIPYYADGHAWVCDGYMSTGFNGSSHLKFHMNWGWNDAHDGWYSFNNFNPNGNTFNYKVGIVTNIRP
ncbi:C10 family peptidase [Flagellimonas onchidii]|uniref:C10 family peptidase n=1 Tax=Flagellimonas onchidii TaxID=2562684 RepID=UPI0010A6AA39|nr:C10 family peptidase [Allomuricauda onchidii]